MTDDGEAPFRSPRLRDLSYPSRAFKGRAARRRWRNNWDSEGVFPVNLAEYSDESGCSDTKVDTRSEDAATAEALVDRQRLLVGTLSLSSKARTSFPAEF